MPDLLPDCFLKMNYIVNLTTTEYFMCTDANARDRKIKKLFEKLDTDTALNACEIGESRWRPDDKIVVATKTKEMYDYIERYYGQV